MPCLRKPWHVTPKTAAPSGTAAAARLVAVLLWRARQHPPSQAPELETLRGRRAPQALLHPGPSAKLPGSCQPALSSCLDASAAPQSRRPNKSLRRGWRADQRSRDLGAAGRKYPGSSAAAQEPPHPGKTQPKTRAPARQALQQLATWRGQDQPQKHIGKLPAPSYGRSSSCVLPLPEEPRAPTRCSSPGHCRSLKQPIPRDAAARPLPSHLADDCTAPV
mmetsp:Transcript_15834/g.35957  ORF Transcript_15834/g.35957 Transcript_15834/m.35957 type:complete len:220 (-) Transcript_15834:285-944(-)